jgi:hypothetical protein
LEFGDGGFEFGFVEGGDFFKVIGEGVEWWEGFFGVFVGGVDGTDGFEGGSWGCWVGLRLGVFEGRGVGLRLGRGLGLLPWNRLWWVVYGGFLGYGVVEDFGLDILNIAEETEGFVEVSDGTGEGALGFADLREVGLVLGEVEEALAEKVDGSLEINLEDFETFAAGIGLLRVGLEEEMGVLRDGLGFHNATTLYA